jgi:hypothetical protein
MGCKNTKTKATEEPFEDEKDPRNAPHRDETAATPAEDEAKYFDERGNPKVTPEAADFLRLTNDDGHPVARRLLEEWSIFVHKHSLILATRDTGGGGGGSAQKGTHGAGTPNGKIGATASQSVVFDRPSEFWCNGEYDNVSHESVDLVGQSFLDYLSMDLRHRRWLGTFKYAVEGFENDGTLMIDVKVTAAATTFPFEVQARYYAAP